LQSLCVYGCGAVRGTPSTGDNGVVGRYRIEFLACEVSRFVQELQRLESAEGEYGVFGPVSRAELRRFAGNRLQSRLARPYVTEANDIGPDCRAVKL